jgi:hypothetical protein
MTKQIKFISRSEYHFAVADKPVPAASRLPDWWKNSPSYLTFEGDATKKIRVRNTHANTAFKKCAPMLDSLTSGYLIPLWADVQINEENDEPFINWRVKKHVFETHATQASDIPVPIGYNKRVFKYMNPWRIVTPPGYSILVVEPFAYRNLPFRPIPAVVDSDVSTLELLFPVWVKDGLDQVVEAGTPIAQIIPFKRNSWQAEVIQGTAEEYEKLEDANFGKHLVNHYSRFVRQTKTYK